jgi:hypothetical protein
MGLECAYWADGSGNINRGCKDLDLDIDKATTNPAHQTARAANPEPAPIRSSASNLAVRTRYSRVRSTGRYFQGGAVGSKGEYRYRGTDSIRFTGLGTAEHRGH